MGRSEVGTGQKVGRQDQDIWSPSSFLSTGLTAIRTLVDANDITVCKTPVILGFAWVMDDRVSSVVDFLKQAADSLGRSFANYWPAADQNDPVERNVSLHFAHVLLTAGFSVFAEADHPDRAKVQGIDVFGLAADNDWFLGCEFKRLFNAEKVLSLSNDVDRLKSFWLRSDYSPSLYGPHVSDAVSRCSAGYGLVGGLHWLSGKRKSSDILDIWNNPDRLSSSSTYGQLAAKLQDVNAVLPNPSLVIEFPTGSRYYLLSAVFSIARSMSA